MSNHLKPITPLTIEGIRAWEWVGNMHSDSAAYESVAEFAKDESKPLAERAEALYLMGANGMGLTLAEMDMEHMPGVNAAQDLAQVLEFMQAGF